MVLLTDVRMENTDVREVGFHPPVFLPLKSVSSGANVINLFFLSVIYELFY
jgi:hypothetical protein